MTEIYCLGMYMYVYIYIYTHIILDSTYACHFLYTESDTRALQDPPPSEPAEEKAEPAAEGAQGAASAPAEGAPAEAGGFFRKGFNYQWLRFRV